MGFVKRIMASILSVLGIFAPLCCCAGPSKYLMAVSSYAEWIVVAIVVFGYITVVTVAINAICYYDRVRKLIYINVPRNNTNRF